MNMRWCSLAGGCLGLLLANAVLADPTAGTPAAPASASPQAPGATDQPAARAPSLMFSDADVAAVEKALAAYERMLNGGASAEPQVQETEPGMQNVYVSAIMDFGDGRWTVWANGYRITPNHQAPDFKVVAVSGNLVEIVVPGEQAARFRLHPDQTWRAGHHDVVEGIFP